MNRPSGRHRRGMTLIELTVVVLTLLGLIGVLFTGAQAWKRGSDRNGCIMSIRQVQIGVRAYQNINNLPVGHSLDIEAEVIGPEKYSNPPSCPSGGTYTFVTTVPPDHTVATRCSLAESEDHRPDSVIGW